MNLEYSLHARDYLGRAKARLAEGRAESLFYAALEIRCGVEARLQQYLEPQNHVTDREKNQWRIGNLARTVTRAFIPNRLTRIRISDRATGREFGTYFYTPVSSELQQLSERLGNYLHAPRTHHKPDDPWWQTFVTEIHRGILLLEDATAGSLLGPPVRIGDSNQFTMPIEPIPGQPDPRDWPHVEITIDVQHFDTLAEARSMNGQGDR